MRRAPTGTLKKSENPRRYERIALIYFFGKEVETPTSASKRCIDLLFIFLFNK
jgi:hypothetical protein